MTDRIMAAIFLVVVVVGIPGAWIYMFHLAVCR